MEVDLFASFWSFLRSCKLHISKEEKEGKIVSCYYKRIEYDFSLNEDTTATADELFLEAFQFAHPNLSEDERLLYRLYDLSDENKEETVIDFGFFFIDFVKRFFPHKNHISKNNILKTLEDICMSDIRNSKEFKIEYNIKENNIPLFTFYHALDPLASSRKNLPKIFKSDFNIEKYNDYKKRHLVNKECVFCNNKTINSHIISDFILKNITDDNMLYTTNFSNEVLDIESLKYDNFRDLNYVGIEKRTLFTTYPLFCLEHDSLKNKGINMENNDNLFSRNIESPELNIWAGRKIVHRFLCSFSIQTTQVSEIIRDTLNDIEDSFIHEYLSERVYKYNQIVNLICEHRGYDLDFYVELDFVLPFASIVVRKNEDLFNSSLFTHNKDIIEVMSQLSNSGYSVLSITPKTKSTVFYISLRNITEQDVNIFKILIYYLRYEDSESKHCKYKYFINDFFIFTFLGYGYLFFSDDYFKNIAFLQKNLLINLLNIKDDSFNRNRNKIRVFEDNIYSANLTPEIIDKKDEIYKRYVLAYFLEKITPILPDKIKYIHGASQRHKHKKN